MNTSLSLKKIGIIINNPNKPLKNTIKNGCNSEVNILTTIPSTAPKKATIIAKIVGNRIEELLIFFL